MAEEADSTPRTCKHCQIEKPLSAFVKMTGGSGRTHKCHECRSAKRRQEYAEKRGGLVRRPPAKNAEEKRERKRESYLRYKAKHPDRVEKQSRTWREANKDTEAFRAKARERYKRWQERHPGREAELKARWREANRDKALAATHAYRRDNPQYAADREKRAVAAKAYRDANHAHVLKVAAEYRERTRERYREHYRRYRQTEKGKVNGLRSEQRRRVRKKGIEPVATSKQVTELLAAAERCFYCGEPFGDALKRTLEHMTPLSKGGGHVIENLTVACSGCNSRKGTKSALEYFDWLAANSSRAT